MREGVRPRVKLLVLGAAPLLVATLGCDSQLFGNGGTGFGGGALLAAIGSGVSDAISRLAEALVLTLVF